MTPTRLSRGLLAALCISCTLVAGCHSGRRRAEQNNPVAIYRLAHQRMVGGDFKSAVKLLEGLTARFPFTPQARQAHLDLIYCYYRDGEDDSAQDAADTFIRENPINPRVDYAYYMKGMIDFERTPNLFERWFHADLTKRPPSSARKSFEAFRRLIQSYPKSLYAHDALQRMVYLRNRLANYDVHVAEYYMRRGAFVGAQQRATDAIQQYDGSPSVQDALKILIAADDRLGLTERADQAREVYAANFSAATPARLVAQKDKHWWQFWK
ncbi:MAG TPA: outer membrane protein assembly factor BamD [Steroidobacteraceae bacterium]|nr:outer membrane protein assembly factor BamD [Steroidobacteraceae bacterium]